MKKSNEERADLGFAVLWFLRSLWRAVRTRLSLRLMRESVRNGVGEQEIRK